MQQSGKYVHDIHLMGVSWSIRDGIADVGDGLAGIVDFCLGRVELGAKLGQFG